MKNYLKDIEKIQRSDDGPFDSAAIINKDGIIEYIRRFPTAFKEDLAPFQKNVIGKHLFDAYPDVSEENSTVIKTLRTGEITRIEGQILTAGEIAITISSVTYPVTDESGNIQGAIDAIRILDYTDYSKTGCDESLSALDTIITKNAEMIKLKKFIVEVARNDSPVFIYGETGTGKELAAQALHLLSPRKDKPFISQNCAAIPDTLLESTFFGTERGGFTGAETKQGLFELADGGTLFLDEINSMDPSMQAKLLKVLEEQQVRKVGGERSIFFDVRIVCASNEKAEDLVRTQKLRADFYYRISVVKIDLPPLRERPEDILSLSQHFIRYYNDKMHKKILGLSRMTEDIFLRWHWPGNVRELKGVIESAFNMEEGNVITLNAVTDLLNRIEDIETSDVQGKDESRENNQFDEDRFSLPVIRQNLQTENINLKVLLEDYERSIIREALNQNRKLNVVAEKLTMSPQKLNYRISKLNLK